MRLMPSFIKNCGNKFRKDKIYYQCSFSKVTPVSVEHSSIISLKHDMVTSCLREFLVNKMSKQKLLSNRAIIVESYFTFFTCIVKAKINPWALA